MKTLTLTRELPLLLSLIGPWRPRLDYEIILVTVLDIVSPPPTLTPGSPGLLTTAGGLEY